MRIIYSITLATFIITIARKIFEYFQIYSDEGGLMLAVASGLFAAKLVVSVEEKIRG